MGSGGDGVGWGFIFGKGKEGKVEGGRPRCFSSLSSLSLPFNWTCAWRTRGEVRGERVEKKKRKPTTLRSKAGRSGRNRCVSAERSGISWKIVRTENPAGLCGSCVQRPGEQSCVQLNPLFCLVWLFHQRPPPHLFSSLAATPVFALSMVKWTSARCRAAMNSHFGAPERLLTSCEYPVFSRAPSQAWPDR